MEEIVICADGCCINGVARMMVVGCGIERDIEREVGGRMFTIYSTILGDGVV